VENAVKPSPSLTNDVKQSILKNKDDKKPDKPKRDSSKHRESKRKERSPSCSPSKKELPRKTHKKTDRKEKNLKDEKYHKRRDEKKNIKNVIDQIIFRSYYYIVIYDSIKMSVCQIYMKVEKKCNTRQYK